MPFQRLKKGHQGSQHNRTDHSKCYAAMHKKTNQADQFILRLGQHIMDRCGFAVDQDVEVQFDPVSYEIQLTASNGKYDDNLTIRRAGKKPDQGGLVRVTLTKPGMPYYGVRHKFGQKEAPLVACEDGMLHLRLPMLVGND